jgi:hypothetical protein
MKSFSDLWRRIAVSRRALEFELSLAHGEISRLRAENRALLNSILGIAGIPPLPPAAAPGPTSFLTPTAPAGHSESSPPSRAADRPLSTPPAAFSSPADVPSAPPPRQAETRNGSSHVSPASTPRQINAPPHRRRSWHQINRMLELQSTKKEVASD